MCCCVLFSTCVAICCNQSRPNAIETVYVLQRVVWYVCCSMFQPPKHSMRRTLIISHFEIILTNHSCLLTTYKQAHFVFHHVLTAPSVAGQPDRQRWKRSGQSHGIKTGQATHLADATHCNTLQYTATHCNTLQHTAIHCNILQHTATHCIARFLAIVATVCCNSVLQQCVATVCCNSVLQQCVATVCCNALYTLTERLF